MTSGFPASVTVLRSPEQVRPRGLPAVCRRSADARPVDRSPEREGQSGCSLKTCPAPAFPTAPCALSRSASSTEVLISPSRRLRTQRRTPPVRQVRNSRLREVKELVRGHRASKWGSRNSSPGCWRLGCRLTAQCGNLWLLHLGHCVLDTLKIVTTPLKGDLI